ncbi:MAG: DUF4954 family protein [Bacteroidales bacterium]|nr:DUF4954 family protein [Bacteroidales bacterium]
MNIIRKEPLNTLGHNFIPAQYIPQGKDEYYLRYLQNPDSGRYRQLNAHEIEVLVRNRNTCDDWNNLMVSEAFNPELVKNCKFFGLVRIGKLEPFFLEFNDLRMPVGLYNSIIINCDFGDNVVVDNVNYMAYYIIGNEVIITNVNEMSTTSHAKFGNGILTEGEPEDIRVWMEICNENGGRAVLPFDGMLPGDAWLWSRDRQNTDLQRRFREMTEKKFDNQRGYYGTIGERTVIKNCSIIKDVKTGSDAYLKGAHKLKNLTIDSTPEAITQIGEGCELVNGIVGKGCRIFYGVKAVRFMLGSNSQLKYGARLINSFLGDNSTISCCEVLNSLIFPAHEQHHNNSFLIAATVEGQSNIAAGATLGSNHNSRGADGEIVAGRGFWPALCTSLKHNSRFAPFTILTKADYPSELDISFPFSLVSNDTSNNELLIMPAYWLLYNQFALERNAWKCESRDKRTEKTQFLESHYLAPDTINSIFEALNILELHAGKHVCLKNHPEKVFNDVEFQTYGIEFLSKKTDKLSSITLAKHSFENSGRQVKLLKPADSYQAYRDYIIYYAFDLIIDHCRKNPGIKTAELLDLLNKPALRLKFENIGGQMIPAIELNQMKEKIISYEIISWQQVHEFYVSQGKAYDSQKLNHAIASLQEINNHKVLDTLSLKEMIEWYLNFRKHLLSEIRHSRQKDYENPFRQMLYSNKKEMEAVIGKLEKTPFIIQQQEKLKKDSIFLQELIIRLELN